MNSVLAITRRELRSAFNSPIALTVILAFLLLTACYLFFLRGFYAIGQADLRVYFSVMPFILAFIVPALTMRSWAEERRIGTYELLLTLPVREFSLVLGKYLSSLSIILIALLLTLPLPIAVSFLGSFDVGILVAQYLGVALAAGAAVAIGEWISSLAKNQISAFVLGVLGLVFLVFIDRIGIFLNLSGIAASLLNWFSLANHYDSFSRGIIDSQDLAYYLVIGFLFTSLATWGLIHRKWS